MKLAMIGLGKMGANMSRRLAADNHQLVVYDVNTATTESLAAENDNILAAKTLDSLIEQLSSPRVVWLMVPHNYVDDSIEKLLAAGLSRGYYC